MRFEEEGELALIKPHPRNPRTHPNKALEKLEKSFERYGKVAPIILSKDGYILAGHARYKAALKKNEQYFPMLWTDLTGDEAIGYMIADNRTQDETSWDDELLTDLLAELEMRDFDLNATMFDDDEIKKLVNSLDMSVSPEDLNREENEYVIVSFKLSTLEYESLKESLEIFIETNNIIPHIQYI